MIKTAEMSFHKWIAELQRDADLNGCGHRMAGTPHAWLHIYQEGVKPSISSILEWCLEDPERFIELRSTELPRAA